MGNLDVINIDRCEPGYVDHQFEIGRYLIWMLTCPVILYQYCNMLMFFGGKVISQRRINFLIITDLAQLAMGVYGGAVPHLLKGKIAIVLAFLFGVAMVYNLLEITLSHLSYFPRALHLELYASISLLLFSWGIFPAMFCLSLPTIGMITGAHARIGFAVGDLLAKNLFGISMWYLTWVLLLPLKQANLEKMGAKDVLDKLDHTDLSTVRHLDPLAHESGDNTTASKILDRDASNFFSALNSDPNSNADMTVLVIENRPASQKLISYMFEKENVSVVFAFDFNTAIPTLRREHSEMYDAILINLEMAEKAKPEATNLRNVALKDPYFLPIIGYSFDQFDLNKFSVGKCVCDDVVKHALDERGFVELIAHWTKVTEFRRTREETAQAEKEHANSSPRLHHHHRRHRHYRAYVDKVRSEPTSPGGAFTISEIEHDLMDPLYSPRHVPEPEDHQLLMEQPGENEEAHHEEADSNTISRDQRNGISRHHDEEAEAHIGTDSPTSDRQRRRSSFSVQQAMVERGTSSPPPASRVSFWDDAH